MSISDNSKNQTTPEWDIAFDEAVSFFFDAVIMKDYGNLTKVIILNGIIGRLIVHVPPTTFVRIVQDVIDSQCLNGDALQGSEACGEEKL